MQVLGKTKNRGARRIQQGGNASQLGPSTERPADSSLEALRLFFVPPPPPAAVLSRRCIFLPKAIDMQGWESVC